MGFFRNLKIQNLSRQTTYQCMKLASSIRSSTPDLAPNATELIESLGEELLLLSRELCRNEKERTHILKGLGSGLKKYGLSETATSNIVAKLTPWVMSEGPHATLPNEQRAMLNTEESQEKQHSVTDQVIWKTSIFMDASLLLVDNKTLNLETPKIGSCLFFAGAANFISDNYKLNSEEYQHVVHQILIRFGLSEKNVMLFLRNLPELSKEPFAQEALTEGKNTAEEWFSDKDPNAPVRLAELVGRWAKTSL